MKEKLCSPVRSTLYHVPADNRILAAHCVFILNTKRIWRVSIPPVVLNWWFSFVPIPVQRGRLIGRYKTCCGRKLVPRKLWRRLKYHVWRSGSSHEVADTVLWLGGWPRTSCYPSYFTTTIFIFVCLFVCLFLAWQPPSGPWPPHSRSF